jgi:hypothetical protein
MNKTLKTILIILAVILGLAIVAFSMTFMHGFGFRGRMGMPFYGGFMVVGALFAICRFLLPAALIGWFFWWLINQVTARKVAEALKAAAPAPVVETPCKHCGKPVQADWVACPHCGKKL